jgi:chromosome segregation ATPase
MESSSSKKSDGCIPRRPGSLEKSRHIPFRDDTFHSPLERRRSELADQLEKNHKKLQELQKEEKTIKDFADTVKQKNDLTFIGEFNHLKKALELPNEVLPNMEEKLGKSRAFLDTLKTKGMTTQELEGHLDSLKPDIEFAKELHNDYSGIVECMNETQKEIKHIKEHYPSISFKREAKKEKIHPIQNKEQLDEALSKVEAHAKKIQSYDQALEKLDIPAHPQKAARLFQERLRYEESWARLCEVISTYKLEAVSNDFGAFLRKAGNEIKKGLDLSEQELNRDEKSLNKRKEELNQHLNATLKEFGLGPSKKLSQAERIESLKSKYSKINEDIQKIRRENENLQQEFDQLEKNAYRYHPHWVEKHHEEHRDMIHQLSEGGLESIKVYWKNVSKGARPV